MNNNVLILIDGSSYLYRAFHAMPSLNNTQGMPKGAVYGVTNMLKSLLYEYQPVYAAVVFDAPGKTFRHKLYPDYKANRPAMPELLVPQISPTHKVVQALGFPLLMETGVEADDVIGTLAKQANIAGMKTLIFTGDKDFAQLVNESITLIDTMKNTRLDVQGVIDKFGVSPELMVDYLSLIGDSTDNVPGVKKVGPKTAVKWLNTYGNLKTIIEKADEFKGKVGENLREALPQLPLTRQLLTIKCDVKLARTPQQLKLNPQNINELRQLYKELRFKKWLSEISSTAKIPPFTKREATPRLTETSTAEISPSSPLRKRGTIPRVAKTSHSTPKKTSTPRLQKRGATPSVVKTSPATKKKATPRVAENSSSLYALPKGKTASLFGKEEIATLFKKEKKPATKKKRLMGVSAKPSLPFFTKGEFSEQYHTLLTQTDFDNWLNQLNEAEQFAFDTETTSLDYLEAQIVGVSFAVKAGEAAYVPLAHDYLGAPKQLSREKVLAALKPLLENPNKPKVGQNLKYDAHILANYGIELQGIAFDTMLESYLLDSTKKHDMDSLAHHYLDLETTSFEDIAGKGKNKLSFNQIYLEHAAPYAAEDADVTLQLHQKLWPQLQPISKLSQIFTEMEMPLVPVLIRMERNGIKIDAMKLREQSTELTKKIQTIEKEAYILAEGEFNLNSPKQLQTILFEKLKLPVLKKTPKKEPSTAVEVLEELALKYPLPKLILEYRSLSKLKSTYTNKLPQQMSPKTGRIHTSYHQAVTATGRLSSTNPNLQNIPVRSVEGRRIRQAFVAPKGYCLLAADYSQIELRIMAHLSQDEKLLTAFTKGEDIHKATAAEVFKVPIDKVTIDQRRSAKAVNFGLIYGMQSYGLAKQLDTTRTKAQEYIDAYFARYPGVKDYMDEMREIAKKQGYVETVFGRRLYIPEIKSRSHQRRQYAERTAINAPMQGTAADLIKRAMIKADNWIQSSHLDIKMLLQVHDELIFEIADEVLGEAKAAIIEAMTHVADLRVPLLVDVGVGKNWDEAH
ncbi:DNA polymerase I [Candidatus Parabeggiatoa sp. HSG14]|uniref:DNA polymerase I n=1 Tax=Candidatus Parabeggiatoa sp. HSG14 TaxID=3055593 RepID=UPI0025A8CF60|nr:DNA polymerase I [Thiotrichales bacterium HSG14]